MRPSSENDRKSLTILGDAMHCHGEYSATAGQGAENPVLVRTITLLNVAAIDPDPDRLRGIAHDLGNLMTSIREYGFLQPIVVSAKSNGRYKLVHGNSRFMAAKAMDIRFIPAIIQPAQELEDQASDEGISRPSQSANIFKTAGGMVALNPHQLPKESSDHLETGT